MDEHVEMGLSGDVGIGMSVPLFKTVFGVVWWRYDAYVHRPAGWGTKNRSEQIRRGGESKRDAKSRALNKKNNKSMRRILSPFVRVIALARS